MKLKTLSSQNTLTQAVNALGKETTGPDLLVMVKVLGSRCLVRIPSADLAGMVSELKAATGRFSGNIVMFSGDPEQVTVGLRKKIPNLIAI